MASDAVTLIMNDHRVLENLFERLKSGDGDRRALVAEVKARLTAHSEAEELRVYPAIKDADPDQSEDVEHAYDEHKEAEALLMRLEETDPDSPQFDRALADCVDAVKHHVEEEESEVLPALAEAVDRRTLERLGAEFEESRLEVLREAGFEGPRGSGGSDGAADATREELYEQAKQAGISGRSTMSKDELADALREER